MKGPIVCKLCAGRGGKGGGGGKITKMFLKNNCIAGLDGPVTKKGSKAEATM